MAVCPSAVSPNGKCGGGGGANIAVIGMMAMTSYIVCPCPLSICIPEFPIFAANDIIVRMYVQEDHSFLVAVLALVVAITITVSSSP